ncbi:hypothetical protein ACHAWX_005846 [Stephanocyclus meneghinianus]
MSRQMILTFFPSFTQRAQRNPIGSFLWRTLFPVESANRCPEAFYETESTIIRLPYLGVSAILGVVIGFSGAISLISDSADNNGNTAILNDSNFYTVVAFLTFGGMNLCALFIHCLWEAPDPSYPVSYPLLWALDCFFTGVSASSLAFASLARLLPTNVSTRFLFYAYMLLHTLGIIFLTHFLVAGEATIFLEVWYLIPILPAGYIILCDVTIETCEMNLKMCTPLQLPSKLLRALSIRFQQDWGLAIFLIGIMFALGGIIFDASACYAIGVSNTLLDLPTAGTCVFLGCDIVFAGLHILWCDRTEKGDLPRGAKSVKSL